MVKNPCRKVSSKARANPNRTRTGTNTDTARTLVAGKGIDLISVDFYDEHNTNGTGEVAENKEYLEGTLYGKLHPHQGVMLVPGVFASDPDHCEMSNVSCPLDAQARQVVLKLDGFFQWAKADNRIFGFNRWHFSNRSTPQLPGGWNQQLGADAMPTVVAKLREIGRWIIERS